MSVKKGVTFRLLPLLFLAKQTTDFVLFLVRYFPKKNPPPIKTTMGKKGWDNTRASFVRRVRKIVAVLNGVFFVVAFSAAAAAAPTKHFSQTR